MTVLRSIYTFRGTAIFAILCACHFIAAGQDLNEESLDSTAIVAKIKSPAVVQTDTTYVKKFLSGVEFKIDYGKLLLAWTQFETKYEVGFNVRFFEKMVLVTEFGQMVLNPLKAYDNAIYYTVEGQYYRVGLDYYTKYNPDNFYFAGLRYGASNFRDEGAFLFDSEYWEDYQEGFGSENITASWFEFVVGTETNLKFGQSENPNQKNRFLLGWNASLRILTNFTNREQPLIYSIPGYGRSFNNVTPALNLYVKYRLGR